ncbi:MAG: radical SAM protein [Bacillota bacterium]
MLKDLRKDREYIYYDLTQSMCRTCRKIVDAQILIRDSRVYMRSICPEHGASEALIAADSEWYMKIINSKQETDRPANYSKEISKGCPFDCGLCSWHEKACNLPVFSITNACNLKCPICFTYNREDKKYFIGEDDFRSIIEWIIESEKEIDLINITGGEPTLHPRLFKLLEIARRKEIGRITLNSNGIKLAEDEDFVRELAGYGVYIILSFNTFDREITKKLHGSDILDYKIKALNNLEKYNIPVTLLNVSVKDLNDKEIGSFVKLMLEKDFIRSLTIQNMTYTGFGGGNFYNGGDSERKHLTLDEVIKNISAAYPEHISKNDFVPLPGSHPLCYSVNYLFNMEGQILPLRRLFSEEEYAAILGKKYLIHPDDNFHLMLMNKINEIWSNGSDIWERDKKLKVLKDFISILYPIGRNLNAFERQRIAEKHIKTIYIHSHMDEDTFDISRISRCGDLVPDVNKRFIPACSYNLFYRMKDERFWVE